MKNLTMISKSVKLNDEVLLTKANLNVIQREFVRTIQGDGFYYSKHDSWLDAYNGWNLADIRDAGEVNMFFHY